MTKLQVALDLPSASQALEMAKAIYQEVDIIEVGTPLIKIEGLGIIQQIRSIVKDKLILADMKTMDTGAWEAQLAFEAGADIVTVCGVAPIKTVEGAIQEGKKQAKKVMVDLIGVADLLQKTRQLQQLDVDLVGIHSGIDEQKQGKTPLIDLKLLAAQTKVDLVVAGGIRKDNITALMPYNPSIIVVGGAITGATNPRLAAKAIKDEITQCHHQLAAGETSGAKNTNGTDKHPLVLSLKQAIQAVKTGLSPAPFQTDRCQKSKLCCLAPQVCHICPFAARTV